jgi:hypothetical protein
MKKGPPMSKHTRRQQQQRRDRITEANQYRNRVQESAAFEQIGVRILADGQHWQFRLGDKTLLQYWPAAQLLQCCRTQKLHQCGSVVDALRKAICYKREQLAAVRMSMGFSP